MSGVGVGVEDRSQACPLPKESGSRRKTLDVSLFLFDCRILVVYPWLYVRMYGCMYVFIYLLITCRVFQ